VVARNAVGVSRSEPATLYVIPVVAWGGNEAGQCRVPITLSNAVQIVAGAEHSLALTDEGL
jgi:hypothetical protein